MRRLALLALILMVSACNLSDQTVIETPGTPTNTPMPTAGDSSELGTRMPTPTELPGVGTTQPTTAGTAGATRTPFGMIPTAGAITGTLPGVSAPLPTQATGESATITSPASGATVSGSPLTLSGMVYNLPQDEFTIQVFGADGEAVSTSQRITLNNPNQVAEVPWSASMMLRNNYTGAAQIRLTAQTRGGTEATLAQVDVNIGQGAAVPVNPNPGASDGTTGSITSPANGGTVTGDPITVSGTAGRIAENQFTLVLMTESGVTLNSQTVTLSGGDTGVVPWSASMGTGGYRGRVEIRAFVVRDGQQVTFATSTVTLQ